MSEYEEFDDEQEAEEPPREMHFSLSIALRAVLCAVAFVCVAWFTSDRANFPLPMLVFHNSSGTPEGTNFFDLYGEGLAGSLMQTYASLMSPNVWSLAQIGWENIDWLGHATAVGAIAIYTLIGVALLGALGVRWTWPTRLAAGYALGVGAAGWIFEQWGIFFLLNRWTVLLSLLLLGGLLGWLWWRARDGVLEVDTTVTEIGSPIAKSTWDFSFRTFAWSAIGIMVGLSFFHAVTMPPTNWDALILYLGNARQTHELGGFPIKVVAQVGVGLGANYPHLFGVTQAGMTRLVGEWTPLVGQWAVPWASLCATVLVYALAHRAFRRRDLALAAALIFRCTPYWISFSHLVSNYPLALLLTALLLLAAHDWLVLGRRRFAVLLLITTAFGCHINYLMPAMWGIALLALLFRWLIEVTAKPEKKKKSRRKVAPPTGWGIVTIALVIALGVASSWYVRNWVVTGNPVYAFFPELFGGENINPEVLESADREWLTNGDGLGRLASQVRDRGMISNVLMLPKFLLTEPNFRWKLAPLFEGFAIPGLLMLLGGLVVWRRWWVLESVDRTLWWLLVFAVFAGMWLYHIALADYYLYQIMPMLIPAALFAAIPLSIGGRWGGFLRVLVIAVVILIAIPFSLMGFKLKARGGDQLYLYALTHPFPEETRFYNRAFPGDVPVWQEIEAKWQGTRLLTHDNRHLIYDPWVEIVHMDDWDVQPVYEIEEIEERLAFYRALDVDLYLRIPNEGNHVINRRAGLQSLINSGHLRPVFQLGDNALYAFPWAEPAE